MLRTKSTAFDKLLLQAIDKTLNSLGKSVGQSIYFHIENKLRVARTDIPQNLEEFQEGLERIFGPGAQFIEILIMKNLHLRIGRQLVGKCERLEFIEYVHATKRGYTEKIQKQTFESQLHTLSIFPVFTASAAKL